MKSCAAGQSLFVQTGARRVNLGRSRVTKISPGRGGRRALRGRAQKVMTKPIRSQVGGLFKGSCLFKQMGCTWNQLELLWTLQLPVSLPIHFNHDRVFAAHNQERGSRNQRERAACKIWPATAGNNRRDGRIRLRGGSQRGGSSRARPEIADAQRTVPGKQPARGAQQALGKQLDIKTKMGGVAVFLFFPRREQIKQKGTQATSPQHTGDEVVPGAMPAAAAAMSKQHHPGGTFRNIKGACQLEAREWDPHLLAGRFKGVDHCSALAFRRPGPAVPKTPGSIPDAVE